MEEEEEGRIQENGVELHKDSSIHKIQKKLEDNRDWISRLPDSLLLHILSHLSVVQVIKTSLLSKRWRYLWRSTWCLDFQNLEHERWSECETTTFIDRFLFHHDGSKVYKLCITIDYEEKHAQFVDSWICFALRCKTEEFNLQFFDTNIPEFKDSTLYKLPHSLFNFGFLTDLKLSGCDLNVPATIQFNSLKTLCLEYIVLDPHAIEHITSNSPVLEDLSLTNCNRWMDLNICITNENVKKLKISECEQEFDIGIMNIHAPNLISLEFFDCLSRTQYLVKKLQSLMIVSFVGIVSHIYNIEDALSDQYEGYDFAALLNDLRHVKELRLSDWCIQALSAKEVRKIDPLSINATVIELKTSVEKWEFPGIAYLLQSASSLETLKISIDDCSEILELDSSFLEEYKSYDFEEDEYWRSRELDISPILQNTKIIEISFFRGWYFPEINKYLKMYWDVATELVKFLLRKSNVLERMIIQTHNGANEHIELMKEITKELSGFPRASPNVGFFFT